MSLPALIFLLILTLFAALWEYLLWWAFRHGNRAVLLHSSGLVVLLFAIPLSITLYNLLVKPFSYVPWVSTSLAWLTSVGCAGPFLMGMALLWNGPRNRITSQPTTHWKWLFIVLIIGSLGGFMAGFQWFGLTSLPVFLLGRGSVHIGFGTFSTDDFLWGFLMGITYAIAGAYGPQLLWWVQTFSERRWFTIGTTLLLLSIMIVAVLLWN